jgi:hypothetical protein
MLSTVNLQAAWYYCAAWGGDGRQENEASPGNGACFSGQKTGIFQMIALRFLYHS